MKAKFTLLFTLIMFTGVTYSQELRYDINDTTIYRLSNIQEAPSFPGGKDELFKFINKNKSASLTDKSKGTVFLTMVVEKDGLLTNIKVLRGLTNTLNNEAIRLMKISPKWISAKINKIPVRVYYSVPIIFR